MNHKNKIITILLLCIILLAVTTIFFLLRPYARAGGDSGEVVLFASSSWMYYFRSPLTVFLHQLAFRILSPLGLDATETIALCSSIAGGLYVVGLLLISTNPMFLLFNLTMPYIFIFISHIEHYAWVNMSLTWFIYFVSRFLKGKGSLIPAVLMFLLASAFHNLALFYLPALIFVCLSITKTNHYPSIKLHPHLSEPQAKLIAIIFLVYFLLMALFPVLFFSCVRGLDVGTERLCPLFHNPDPQHYYFTMFSVAHLKLFLYFIKMSSPFSLPAILVLSPWFLRGRFYWFLLIMTLCGLGWAFIWHPDMGRGDWDLFGSFAIPSGILAGLLLKDLFCSLKTKIQISPG